ncbi:precorrin-6A synthase (deacetylating) [Ancylobacter sp. SL191]|uniref:precorrin-6A synthase (deacetylating) n=1 Tax=Ancylobacter sp. SL191 TaxID=2995166 RepID=UPI002270E0DF|nr:precorrin-6A synthase (deacetylating) [Ancylobacter sp. SL191]WAC28324.1 precorrin-6A synthase (deacetylating) [Ancylobacter sp. SL191]
MRSLLVIGIGMGEAGHLTFRAAEAIARADLFLLLDKGEAAQPLVARRAALIARFGKPGHRLVELASPRRVRPALPGDGEKEAGESEVGRAAYRASVAAWHGERAALFARVIRDMQPDETAALLVWGDPMLYDSTLRVTEAAADVLAAQGHEGFALEVEPGLTALQLLCAAHRIPLNGVGAPVLLTTGRRVAEETPDAPAFAVLLDDGTGLAALHARGWAGEVFWAANLGTQDERLLAGPLPAVAATIRAARAAVKVRAGWVMDVWLARAG